MFRNCRSLEEGKLLFKRLALRLHPDTGGDHDLMISLTDCYESFKNGDMKTSDSKKKSKNRFEKSFENIFPGDAELEILAEIKKYSLKHPKYNMDFTNSVEGFLEENGFITSAQYNALVRGFYTFRMDRDDPGSD